MIIKEKKNYINIKKKKKKKKAMKVLNLKL